MALLKNPLVLAAALLALPALLLVACAWLMETQSADALFKDLSVIPENKAGLVLGCSPFLKGGGTNLYFKHRMEAAAGLYRAGKVSFLLVSGDNKTRGYDETSAMKKALMKLGIPEDHIVCDYAGLSTFDSMIRAREVFQLKSFTIITQRDHALRAVYIARKLGLDVRAFPAEDVGAQAGFKTKAREALARVRAVLDMNISGREGRFLSGPMTIGRDDKSP